MWSVGDAIGLLIKGASVDMRTLRLLDSALLVSELVKRPSKTRQCLCWEEEFIWPLAKEVLLLRKQQREVHPCVGSCHEGADGDFKAQECFQMSLVPWKAKVKCYKAK